MIPSMIAMSNQRNRNFVDQKPRKPVRYPRATTIMEEIFIKKQVRISPSSAMTKFHTLPAKNQGPREIPVRIMRKEN